MDINHFSEYTSGNASEFIKPGGNIDITSHGLGSGIYGVSNLCIEKYPPSSYKFSGVFRIENPYKLTTTENCDDYIEISKTMMRSLDRVRIDQELHETRDQDLDFNPLASRIAELIDDYDLPKLKYIDEALSSFWHDYKNRVDIVEMPINYVLKRNGYDGVCSTPGTYCDRWCKGYVKFIPYPELNESEVGVILNRHGITKEVFTVAIDGRLCRTV
jgi:hypothetical protein